MIVSARLTLDSRALQARSTYADGCVTNRGTFQKFFEQHELRDWISRTLGASPVAAAPRIFYVFRDEQIRFASRQRSHDRLPRTNHRWFASPNVSTQKAPTPEPPRPHGCPACIVTGIGTSSLSPILKFVKARSLPVRALYAYETLNVANGEAQKDISYRYKADRCATSRKLCWCNSSSACTNGPVRRVLFRC